MVIGGISPALSSGFGQASGIGQTGSGISGMGGAGKSSTVSFSDQLESALQTTSDSQKVADVHLQSLGSGNDTDLHNTMIALEEADIHLRSMVAVRDKVVDAYQQMMNMAI